MRYDVVFTNYSTYTYNIVYTLRFSFHTYLNFSCVVFIKLCEYWFYFADLLCGLTYGVLVRKINNFFFRQSQIVEIRNKYFSVMVS